MELVSREEVLALYEREHSHLATNVYEFGEMLKDISVVEERKVGKWILTKRNGILCGVCHSGFRRMPTLDGKPMFVYCPLCGAKMDGYQVEAVAHNKSQSGRAIGNRRWKDAYRSRMEDDTESPTDCSDGAYGHGNRRWHRI